jgi:predicted  nucleic acid-binding Zn-ribbon protein
MHPSIKHLIDLQAVDLRLNDVNARLAVFPRRLADIEARVSSAKQQIVTEKEALLQSVKDRKRYELDVEQWKERARKYRDQSSEVKTNEAYKALVHEIQNAEAEMAKAEDRLLERMVAGEEFDRRVKAAEIEAKKTEAEAQAERATIEADKVVLEKQLSEAQAARTEAVSAIPEDLLDHYQRIAKRHNNISLAEVRDETCTLCGVRVRPHVFQEMRRDDCTQMFHCETCTRILYYVERAPAGVAPPASTSNDEPSEQASAQAGATHSAS